MSRPNSDRGAAAIWVLGCGAVLFALALVIVLRSLAVLARHRAESAADFAALAAAAKIGVAGDPCAAARNLATRNGATLQSCSLSLDAGGRTGTVVVRVLAHVDLPVVGERDITASARAGRLPVKPTRKRQSKPSQVSISLVCHAGPDRNRSKLGCILDSSDDRGGNRVELSVSEYGEGAIPVVGVSGEVDVYAAPALREGLTELLQDGRSVVVDLTDVGFLDSTGLGALVAARTAAAERGASLPLVCTHQRILKLFTITGLDGVFSIHDTVDEAIAGLRDHAAEA